jgi:hypothetical protein
MNGADERGDYKPVPLKEDVVEARKNAPVEVSSSPCVSINFRSCAVTDIVPILAIPVWPIASYCVSSILMTVVNKVYHQTEVK